MPRNNFLRAGRVCTVTSSWRLRGYARRNDSDQKKGEGGDDPVAGLSCSEVAGLAGGKVLGLPRALVS